MNGLQRDVEAFHRHVGATVGESPAVRIPDVRAGIIESEALELVSALRDPGPDLAKVVGELCDVLYAVLGTAVACGVDIEPAFALVHAANMRKLPNGDGKAIKPEGWTAAGIAALYGRSEPEED